MVYHVLGRVGEATKTWGSLPSSFRRQLPLIYRSERRLGYLSVLSGPLLVLWVCLREPQATHWTLEKLMVPLV